MTFPDFYLGSRKFLGAAGLVLVLLSNSYSVIAQENNNSEQEMVEKIVSYIESEMASSEIKGLSLSIVHEQKVVHLQGFGVADESGRRVQPETPFLLGSVSKSFTAIAILQLRDQGKIDLDQPVQTYIPWFEIADQQASSQITIRHLLNQVSGFSVFHGRTRFTDRDLSDSALETGVRELRTVKLSASPGERFEYSNTNYDVLGLVVQTVSGISYEEYIKQNIFTPLNMTSSFTNKQEAIENNLAVGYNYFLGQPIAVPNAPYPRKLIASGFLISSAQDLTNYMIVQLNDGRFQSTRLLSSESLSISHTPQIGDYAMGWFSTYINGKRLISHDGLVSNYKANIGMLPSEGWGVALLVNGQDMILDATVRILHLNVMRIMAGEDTLLAGDALLEIAFYIIVLVLIAQLVGIARTFILLRRWRAEFPELNRSVYLGNIVIPFVFSMLLAWCMLIFLPNLDPISWSTLLLFAPDAWLILITGIIALVWGTSRAILLTTFVWTNRTEN